MSRGFAVHMPRLQQSTAPTTASVPATVAGQSSESPRRRSTCYNTSARVPLRHLIPLMDTFNHDNSARSSVQFVGDDETSSGEFVLTTHNDWEAGDEVFIHYGHFTPAEFLTGYGFVPKLDMVATTNVQTGIASDSRPMIDIARGASSHVTAGGACSGINRCTKLKSSLLSALGSHALELTAPSCLIGLANRSSLERVIAASLHAPQGQNRQKSPAALAAAAAIDAAESLGNGNFEIFVLDMIASELHWRLQTYGSTLEQDEQEQRERTRRKQEQQKETMGEAHCTDCKDAQSTTTSRGGLSIDALLSLFVGEKRLLRECEHKIAEALMRARLRHIGIT